MRHFIVIGSVKEKEKGKGKGPLRVRTHRQRRILLTQLLLHASRRLSFLLPFLLAGQAVRDAAFVFAVVRDVAMFLALMVAVCLVDFGARGVALVAGLVDGGGADVGGSGHFVLEWSMLGSTYGEAPAVVLVVEIWVR